MPQSQTVRVLGYREFLRACNRAEKQTKTYVRGTFREVGDIVRLDASRMLSPVSARSAAGYRTRVRVTGVVVEQSLRKTTGTRPEWGSYQMREVLVPAMEENAERIVGAMDNAIDRVCDHFEGSP